MRSTLLNATLIEILTFTKSVWKIRKRCKSFKKRILPGSSNSNQAGSGTFWNQLRPQRFEDIVSTNALFRPGPIQNIDEFIRRKNGQAPITYPNPRLKPILQLTYGIIVYQEQVMQVAAEMGGFTLGQADLLRRAMSKKKQDVIDRCGISLSRER